MTQVFSLGGMGPVTAIPMQSPKEPSNIWRQDTTGARIMVVVAHADDEVLMCGGTIARHAEEGDTVRVLILSPGVAARGIESLGIEDRIAAADRASDILGFSGEILDLPDQQFDTVPLLSIIKVIEQRMSEFSPTLVYTHFHGDMNADHRIVSEAVKTACRPHPEQSVTTLLMGEVPSSTEWGGGFAPNTFVSLGGLLDKKIEAFKQYKSEVCAYPHPRSVLGVEHLAWTRGASVGVGQAEAFMCVRNVL